MGDSLYSVECACISKFVLIQHILSTQVSDTDPVVLWFQNCTLKYVWRTVKVITILFTFGQLVTGIKDEEKGAMLKRLFQADYFRIVVCDDDDTVEVCGALKVTAFSSIFFSSPEQKAHR